MTKFTEVDFDTISNYLEFKQQNILDNKPIHNNSYLRDLYIVDETSRLVKEDFKRGLFNDIRT